MPDRPIESYPKENASRNKYSHSHHSSSTHHGKINGHHYSHTLHSSSQSAVTGGTSPLQCIPSESLTHITTFLNPSSLLALARTNKYLHDHVNQENTWRRAFVYQFLGISPEADLADSPSGDGIGNGKARLGMLRRQESSWKREFIVRYNLSR